MTNNHGRIIRIVSFGYGHNPAPEAEITLDLRRRFRNPHADPTMRQRTGLDEDVYAHVLETPGVRDLAAATALAAHDLAHSVSGRITIACGCVGGRHRSVAVARHIAEILADGCAAISIAHRDVDRPVLPSGIHTTAEGGEGQ
ncbi:RapZ C-terminal domain-containing protein [Embleya hyalina]|uniref:Nucleotide-binding protein n=1 Tax=Embleya hyalina TaxID=516124 RepID=A0A401YR87_9ACTN|nr:RNase adapter RapZ [Embleya hyalina]GCD97118.1 nucleotide-binding protein [Embleya hyalina]